MTIAKGIALPGLLAMTGVLIYGFAAGDFADEGSQLLSMPWGTVSLVDLYVRFILFSGWIVYREKSTALSIVWVALMMVSGQPASTRSWRCGPAAATGGSSGWGSNGPKARSRPAALETHQKSLQYIDKIFSIWYNLLQVGTPGAGRSRTTDQHKAHGVRSNDMNETKGVPQ